MITLNFLQVNAQSPELVGKSILLVTQESRYVPIISCSMLLWSAKL